MDSVEVDHIDIDVDILAASRKSVEAALVQ
jgi:hypothetical protein